uniref:Uncharacterized protein n=1 Tax=Brassica oleracea var. oleracea TaxID=109376 RepID=A0A0D3EB20_BRAOL
RKPKPFFLSYSSPKKPNPFFLSYSSPKNQDIFHISFLTFFLMASSSSTNFDDEMDEKFDQIFDRQFENLLIHHENRQEASRSKKKRAYIEKQREQGHMQLRNDYFSENPTYPSHMFRRRFRMNKLFFMRIVDRLSAEIPYFQQRRDATGRFGHSPLQKATAAIRMMAYGCPADTVDEYLRLGTFCSRNHKFIWRWVSKKTHTRRSSTTARYWRDTRISRDDRKH